jgi:hypothetical protein
MIDSMIRASLIAFLVIGMLSCQSGGGQERQAAADNSDEWEVLFDGTSVDHWKSYCGDGFPHHGWVIEDGALKVLGSGRGEAGRGGDIITRDKFGNFELSLEWKVSEGGNSGIFYLARERCGENRAPIWQSSPEMQILDNQRHPDARLGVDGNRQAGSLYDLIPANPQNAKPAGEWNQVNIIVYRGTVIHNQNGQNVLEYHLWTDKWNEMVKNSKFKEYDDFINVAEEGHIGLQDHGDDVWFRNIRIKRM